MPKEFHLKLNCQDPLIHQAVGQIVLACQMVDTHVAFLEHALRIELEKNDPGSSD